jgi:hypothetical protein
VIAIEFHHSRQFSPWSVHLKYSDGAGTITWYRSRADLERGVVELLVAYEQGVLNRACIHGRGGRNSD